MKKAIRKEPGFVIVVGASAGGLNCIIELAAQLNMQMDAAVFVVLHVSKISLAEILLNRIQKSTPFTCKIPVDQEPILPHHLYLAAADKHLLIKKNHILLGQGPAENRWRPSIDVLFRSAAAAYNGHTIGIILSGLMQDGTAGMQAIKRSKGTCIVQDPREAEYPDMPMSVINNLEVDYCLPLHQMGAVLEEKTRADGMPLDTPPKDIQAEAAIAERVAVGIENVEPLGSRSYYSCPDCGGALWEMTEGDVLRYRCHVGHAFTGKELGIRQTETLEATLWVALRMMEERKHLLVRMAEEENSKGWARSAAMKTERSRELDAHIIRLKQLLFDQGKTG